MDSTRNKINEVTQFIKKLGITINLNTNARGHQGFFLKNRIDISKRTPEHKILQTIVHEFAHYINSQIQPDIKNSSIEILFGTKEDLTPELINITNFIDENSKLTILKKHKQIVKEKIILQEKIIKSDYPTFKRSKKFKEFDKYIRFSKAKYLLKYDRIKYITPFLRRTEYYSIDTLDKDFNMPKAFSAYIKLRSLQRKQSGLSAKINKLTKYYTNPSELFARFIESYYINKSETKKIAPKTYEHFEKLLNQNYYKNLSTLFMVLK
jgi:hypothetical protein